MKETKKGRKNKEKNYCRTAEQPTLPGQASPAVKTSNHMRKSKRFLRVPFLHLLNFYNLVCCQALGSKNTFRATATLRSRKTEKRDNEQDGWLNHPPHPHTGLHLPCANDRPTCSPVATC